MEGKIVRNGLFKVYPDKNIYRRMNGKWEKTKIFLWNSKKSSSTKYYMTSTMDKGKQIHAHVHRLIGEALVPNPDNKDQVFHRDGNTLNNEPSNLIWVTSKERAQLSTELGKGRRIEDIGIPCVWCGELTAAQDQVCTRCKQQEKKYERNKKRIEGLIEKFKDVDVDNLSKREKIIIEMRTSGKSLQQIGDRLGFSRERARQLEENILKGHMDLKDIDVKKIIDRDEINLNEIKPVRDMIGKSRKEMANLLGISQSTYLKMEGNPVKFRVEHIRRLENVLDIKINIR